MKVLKIYDTMKQEKVEFKPINPKCATMYVCGPTVYDHIHIGNARPVVFFDLVKSYLTYRGIPVKYASNITDIDDKIIAKAKDQGTNETAISALYTKEFFEVIKKLGVKMPDILPYATKYITQDIEFIQKLLDLGYAYIAKSGIYFKVKMIKDYGRLSKQSVSFLRANLDEISKSDKLDLIDFAVWKFSNDGLTFASPWGDGRPGWHTECAVMTSSIFPEGLDIHGGGSDLKFPHHENEIALCEAVNKDFVAKYWMHVGRVDLESTKMSKSLGNTILVKGLLKEVDGSVLRYYILNYHYRQPFSYDYDVMMQIGRNYDKIIKALKKAKFMLKVNASESKDVDEVVILEFEKLMDDDFSTPNVVALIDKIIRQINKQPDSKLVNALTKILDVLGINQKQDEVSKDDVLTYHNWVEARAKGDFLKADELRDKLLAKGLI